MSDLHWRFFLTIDADFEATSRYVEFAPANFQVYSIEFARILLSTAAEVDAIAKLLCADIEPACRAENIDDYRKIICGKYPKLPEMEVLIDRFGLSFYPWKAWAQGQNPEWWKSHTRVKHRRHRHFGEASLENTIGAVGGLFCLLLYLRHQELFALKLEPWPSFLTIPGEPARLVANVDYQLPDFVNKRPG